MAAPKPPPSAREPAWAALIRTLPPKARTPAFYYSVSLVFVFGMFIAWRMPTAVAIGSGGTSLFALIRGLWPKGN